MKRLRQAREADGIVSVLCFACRRTKDGTKQQGLGSFFSAKPKADDAQADTAAPAAEGVVQCSKCLRVMESGGAGAASSGASKARVLPQIARIRQYQRVAAEQGVPFAIADGAAAALMRLPCVCCGVAAPTEGHGLTRLRVWPEGLERPLSSRTHVRQKASAPASDPTRARTRSTLNRCTAFSSSAMSNLAPRASRHGPRR